MKSYVIAITSLQDSVNIAQRCIESGRKYGINSIEIFQAITPHDDPENICKTEGIIYECFKNNKYSRYLNTISCFLSHYFLWKKVKEIDEPILILEHDAVFTREFDTSIKFDKLLSIGHPSYGKFKRPTRAGVNLLTSKPYLPGAHAYILNPNGADIILEYAKTVAEPTDIFLSKKNFPWIQEYYPWVVEVKDTFSTVQEIAGSIAKHTYTSDYKITNI
jgi:GR25 family glycosyltransferase involved in LPS biosynthesis